MIFKVPQFLLCLGIYLATSKAAKAPFIKTCNIEDSDCLLSSGQAALPYLVKGLPDIGVPAADPLYLDSVKSQEGGLELVFKDMKVEGLKMCKITKLHRTLNKFGLHLELECPISATGKYTAGGKLLFIPVEGDGDFEIKTDSVRAIIDVEIDVVDSSDGAKYWKLSKYTSSYETIEKFYFDMKNLFNGNQEKAQPILEILNHSWKEVINTVGKPVITEVIAKAVQVIEKFFAAVPLSELQK